MDPPGFKRCEGDGRRPFYTSIPQVVGELPCVLDSLAKVKKFLERNPSRRVSLENFDFGKKRKKDFEHTCQELTNKHGRPIVNEAKTKFKAVIHQSLEDQNFDVSHER